MGSDTRIERDSMGEIAVPADRLWGAQTERSLHHFSIGRDLMPPELIEAYALIKHASADANCTGGRLDRTIRDMIVSVCDELRAGQHRDMFPLHVWMTGSGTQFNMNVNEVISNRACQMAGEPLGSKKPVHPNDHVNMAQSSNDTFPAAIHIACTLEATRGLIPALEALRAAFARKAHDWRSIVKIGRTHLQDAVPMTLGQEMTGYVGMLDDSIARVKRAVEGLYPLVLGGTAIGTGVNAAPGFGAHACAEIARVTGVPFTESANKIAHQGSHDALVDCSGALRLVAVGLYKIANDLRLLACGPRAGIGELKLPQNEPGSSIMPGKVNPTQAEALAMIAVQVMGNDMAATFGGASGMLEMNVYKPLLAFNIINSLILLRDGATNFRRFLVEGMEPDRARIENMVSRSLMLVTALSPEIGYDAASRVAHHAEEHGLDARTAAIDLGVVDGETFDRLVNPLAMTGAQIDGSA